MKRSLLIAIAVLLIAALFVGCNADKIEEDQLVEVTIASDLSKGLIAEGASTASVADLYWYYSAEKTAGYFKTGETEWSAVKEGKGLEGSLGQMSTGGWNFCFYGFKEEQATKPSEPEATAIFYQKNLRKAITGPVALEIALSRGAGSLGAPIAVFGDDLFWKYNSDIGTVTLTITNNGEPVHVYEGTPANGKVTFSTDEDEFVLSAEGNLLAFKVVSSYTIEGVAFEEQLGYSELNIVAESGMKYTITCDTNGIDFYPYGEATPVVSIGDINVPVTATATVVASTTQGYASKVETSNTPAASTTAKTTVEFPVNLAGKNVTVETSSAEVASSKSFVVSAGSGAVASIELSISDGTKTFGEGNKAQVTTFIGTGLVGVEVHYSGNDAADIVQTDVSYDPATGYVTFLTPHFSEFYVTAKGEAQIGTKVYKTLVEAIADAQDGAIVTLLKDTSGAGIFLGVADAKTITVDLGGFTYTCSGPAVGSSKTETQAWHLEKNNTVTIKNGTLTSTATAGVYMLVQNYCNLTLDDVTLDGTHLPGSGRYVLSGNNGDILITGETNITAKEGDFAFDVCYTNYYPDGVRYLFDDNYVGTVTGTIQLDVWGSKPAETKCKLTIKAGTFNGAFDIQSALQDEALNDIIILGGTFNGVEAVAFANNTVYGSLADAVAAVPNDGTEVTIRLLKDTEGTGIGLFNSGKPSIATNKNIIIDLGGYTYTVNGGTVGSTGTESQAWHLEKGNKVVIKNGALRASCSSAQMLIQNYCDLTLEDVDLDNSANSRITYVVSNNFGSLTVKGNTIIKAHPTQVAFDVWYGMSADYDDGVTILFDESFSGRVDGKVEFGAASRASDNFEDAVADGDVGITVKDNTGIFNVTPAKGSQFAFDYSANWARTDANPFVW